MHLTFVYKNIHFPKSLDTWHHLLWDGIFLISKAKSSVEETVLPVSFWNFLHFLYSGYFYQKTSCHRFNSLVPIIPRFIFLRREQLKWNFSIFSKGFYMEICSDIDLWPRNFVQGYFNQPREKNMHLTWILHLFIFSKRKKWFRIKTPLPL